MLVFKDFVWNPQVPRLTNRAAGGEQEQEQDQGDTDEEAEYKVFKQTFFSGIRDTPFAYDPVNSQVQSASAYQRTRTAYETALLGGVGPTTSSQSLVLSGRFIFMMRPANQGVCLAKIEHIGRNKSPRSPDVNLTCSTFTHSPQPDVSGFFGTFRGSPAGTGKAHLGREQVLVYNVEYITKTKTVSLQSLRQLLSSP